MGLGRGGLVSVPRRHDAPLELTGIDGGGLPGFMATLGAFRLLQATDPTADLRLAWRWSGRWTPQIFGVADSGGMADGIVEELRRDAAVLRALGGDDALFLEDRYGPAVDSLRHPFDPAAEDHRSASWLAALGSEACPKPGKSPSHVDHTPLKALGGGKQRFIPTLISLFEDVGAEQVDRSLMVPWTHADAAPSLRWDPIEDRRHAYRWLAPMVDPPTTEAGGNALAAAAIPLFASVPTSRGLRTCGFRRRSGTWITWPIWSPAFDLPMVQTLLGLRELQAASPDRALLASYGVAEILRSERIVVDKYVNFTPAWSP